MANQESKAPLMAFDADKPLQMVDIWPERATRGRLSHDLEKAQELMVPESLLRKWCEHLRFVVDVRAAKLGHDFEIIESADERESREPYVAISYRWQLSETISDQLILSPVPEQPGVKKLRSIRAPVGFLERSFAFAATMGIRKIWIDQECIHQDNEEDKSNGIQCMHIVYRWCTITLVMLGCHVKTQSDISVLRHLTDPQDRGQNTLRGYIKNDVWWTRAWTAHELGLSTNRQLRYIIGWDKCLDASNKEWKMLTEEYNQKCDADNRQNVPREWVLTGGEMFSVAHMMPLSPLLTQTLTAVLANGTQGMGGNFDFAQPFLGDHEKSSQEISNDQQTRGMTMSEAMSLLFQKDCLIKSDKLAIIGNLAEYSLRIDTMKAARYRLGFSACAMALALYNGDLSSLFTWLPKQPQRGTTFAERAVRPLASWLPDHHLSLNDIVQSPPPTQRFQSQPIRGPRAVVLDGKLAVEGLLWDILPYRGLEIIQEQMQASGDMTIRLQLLLRSLYEQGQQSILELIIVLAMQRQLTSPQELLSIINQLEQWLNGASDWPTVFKECNISNASECSEIVGEICEDIAQGKPLFIGRCPIGDEKVACICHSPATQVFSPLTSLNYDFGINDWSHLFRDDRYWSVEECPERVPERIVGSLRKRVQNDHPVSDRVFTIQDQLAITPSPRLSSAGLFISAGFIPIYPSGGYQWFR